MDYEFNIKLTEDEFINNTLENSLFTINDVNNDNACMYRSISNYIYYATPHTNLTFLKRFKDWGNIKEIDIVSTDFGYFSEKQESLARFIQCLIVEYVKNNPKKIINEYNMSIENLVPIFHDITYDEYINAYSTFAGEESNKEEDKYYDRWGSLLELYIISDIINCPIVVLNSQKYDKRTNKITNGKIINSKPQKDVRFKVFQIINKDLIHNDILPIYLVWKKYNNNGHFMACYPNDKDIVKNIILNQ
jgi:hypothetical protein